MKFFDWPLLPLAALLLVPAAEAAAPLLEQPEPPPARAKPGGPQNAAAPAGILVSQNSMRPPGGIGEGGEGFYPEGQSGGAEDAAGLLVRLGRLESQMRQINGQIEQMQFETRRLEEQLKKFQEDVDFRFREGGPRSPAQKRGGAAEPQIDGDSRNSPQMQNTAAAGSRSSRRGDAFDPAMDPTAPGAPRPLGSLAAGRALGGGDQSGTGLPDPSAPLDLAGGRSRSAAAPQGVPPAARIAEPAASHTLQGVKPAAAPPATPKQEYALAMASLKTGSFAEAENGFAGFLQKYPKDKLAADAVYYLGESYYLRGRRREAAEQFLKISTQYPNSPRAPQALLRLGQSLRALGAKEQACATFNEIPRKYPGASSMIRTGAAEEAKRTQC